jgi:hypothetical protein
MMVDATVEGHIDAERQESHKVWLSA